VQRVTRDVITDLWPLYTAGEASADTRALIDSFLQDDPEFARTLHELEREKLPMPEVPMLAPDEELKTLARIRRRIRGPVPLLMFAMTFSCFAFGTLVSDTSFDVSPRRFIVTSMIAVGFWAAFLFRLFKGRREVLIRVRRR
jgi:anti-sigma factor RsiW